MCEKVPACPNDLLTNLNQVNHNLQFTMERSTANFLLLWLIKMEQKFGLIYTASLLIQKDVFLLHEITHEVAPEIFHFVWLDTFVILLKKKT